MVPIVALLLFFSGPVFADVAYQVGVANDQGFRNWRGPAPGYCTTGTSAPCTGATCVNLVPDAPTFCTGKDAYISSWTISYGNSSGVIGVWQISAKCSTGEFLGPLPKTAPTYTNVKTYSISKIGRGFSVIYGQSGNWMDSFLGEPLSGGGAAWIDNCRDKYSKRALVSGFQGWSTTDNCIASGFKFFCSNMTTVPEEGANLVMNPSFEDSTVDFSQVQFPSIDPGAANITGWQVEVTAGPVEANQFCFAASDGAISVGFGGNLPATLSQVVPTVPGNAYTLLFDSSANSICTPKRTMYYQVKIGQSPYNFTVDNYNKTLTHMEWTTKTIPFLAFSNTTKITFISLTQTLGGCGPQVDYVRVYQTSAVAPASFPPPLLAPVAAPAPGGVPAGTPVSGPALAPSTYVSGGTTPGLNTPPPVSTPSPSSSTGAIVGGTLAGVIVVIMVAAAGFFIFWKRKSIRRSADSLITPPVDPSPPWVTLASRSSTQKSSGSNPNRAANNTRADLGKLLLFGSGARAFRLAELEAATNIWSEANKLGEGGYGPVFYGLLSDLGAVAIKRGKETSQQGEREFQVEVALLSRLRHPNLVELLGYCDEKGERALIYRFVGNGNLREHLECAKGRPLLSWQQRLEIALGAARGLDYLHRGGPAPVVHRDVKASNILIDFNYSVKLADFGLSRLFETEGDDETHISLRVLPGTEGYMDPELRYTRQLRISSDLYSFGVVLLELLSGRRALDPKRPRNEVYLTGWALPLIEDANITQIVDARLGSNYSVTAVVGLATLAKRCLSFEHADRPSAGEAVVDLERLLAVSVVSSGDLYGSYDLSHSSFEPR